MSSASGYQFSQCHDMSDESLSEIAEGCPLLHSNGLYKCQYVTDDGALSVSKGRLLLCNINLAGICATDEGIMALAYVFRPLQNDIGVIADCSWIKMSSASVY